MVDMDFHSMKRKRLQALCKKHGIPANLKNKELADRLSLIFKETEVEGTVGSGNAGMKKNTESNVELIDLVSPSPGLEEKSEFSAKILKTSDVERLEFETNLSPEITREDMKSGLNKEQVGNNNGGLDSAPDEIENHLVEGEVEKFDDQTNLHEDVCGTGKDGAEIEKQDNNVNNPEGSETEKRVDNDANNPEESDRNDLNLLVVSHEEFRYPLVEGEVHKSDERVCVLDAVHNVENGRCDVDTMCLDTSIVTMHIDEKTDVAVEDEVHSPREVNFSELNILEMIGTGTATRNAETCEARFVSSPKMSLSPASERTIGLSPKLLNNSESKMFWSVSNFSPETLKVGIEVCDVEENIPIDVNKEQVGDIPEVVLAAPNETAMSDEDLERVPSEEFGDRLIEGEVEKLSDKSNLLDDVCENGKGGDEPVERGDYNSPQESNMKDVNVLLVSQDESGYPMVEEIQKSDDNIYIGVVHNHENSGCEVDAKDTDEKTNLTAEPFADDVPSSSLSKYSDGTPDQFQRTYSVNEVRSSGLNIHQDICEEKMENVEYSQEAMHITASVNLFHGCMERRNINTGQGEVTGFLENSDVYDDAGRNGEDDTNSPQDSDRTDLNISQVSHKEFSYPKRICPETPNIDIESCDMKENIQVVVNKELVGGSQEVVNEASNVMAISDEDREQVSFEEFGDHLMEGEVEKLSDKNVLEDVCENGKGRDEAVEQGDHNSPQGSNMKNVNGLYVSQEESGNPLVEMVNKSDDNISNGGVYNLRNSGSEVDGKDTDVIRNLTAEPFADDVPNVPSNFKYSDGTPDHFLSTSPLNDIKSSGLNIHQDACKEESKSPQETGLIAGPGECIGFSHNMTVEQFIDEVRSSTFEDSDGTPVQFLPNGALSEVKSNLNICEMDVPGIVIGNEDIPRANFVSSSKTSLSPTSERMIGFSPKQLNNSETKELQSETIFFPETSSVVDIGICDVEENMQIDDVNTEQVDDNQQVIHAASSVSVMNHEHLVKVASVEVGDNLLEEEVEKSGLIVDSEDCIVFLSNNLESSLPSATKGFPAESYFDPSTHGDVVASCDMQNDQVLHMANELGLLQTSMEESNSVEGEVTRLFDNSDVHEDADVTGVEDDKNQHYIERDMDSIEKYLLSEFQSIDDANGKNSDEYAPTMPQPGEMISASGAVSGDEGIFQEKLETPLKSTPIASLEDNISFYPNLLESSMKKELEIVKSLPVKRARDVLGTSDMKENIKSVKKEQVGTVISKSAFPKRKPLQDLQHY